MERGECLADLALRVSEYGEHGDTARVSDVSTALRERGGVEVVADAAAGRTDSPCGALQNNALLLAGNIASDLLDPSGAPLVRQLLRAHGFVSSLLRLLLQPNSGSTSPHTLLYVLAALMNMCERHEPMLQRGEGGLRASTVAARLADLSSSASQDAQVQRFAALCLQRITEGAARRESMCAVRIQAEVRRHAAQRHATARRQTARAEAARAEAARAEAARAAEVAAARTAEEKVARAEAARMAAEEKAQLRSARLRMTHAVDGVAMRILSEVVAELVRPMGAWLLADRRVTSSLPAVWLADATRAAAEAEAAARARAEARRVEAAEVRAREAAARAAAEAREAAARAEAEAAARAEAEERAAARVRARARARASLERRQAAQAELALRAQAKLDAMHAAAAVAEASAMARRRAEARAVRLASRGLLGSASEPRLPMWARSSTKDSALPPISPSLTPPRSIRTSSRRTRPSAFATPPPPRTRTAPGGRGVGAEAASHAHAAGVSTPCAAPPTARALSFADRAADSPAQAPHPAADPSEGSGGGPARNAPQTTLYVARVLPDYAAAVEQPRVQLLRRLDLPALGAALGTEPQDIMLRMGRTLVASPERLRLLGVEVDLEEA